MRDIEDAAEERATGGGGGQDAAGREPHATHSQAAATLTF